MSMKNMKNNWGKPDKAWSFGILQAPKSHKTASVPYLFALDLCHFGHLVVTDLKEIIFFFVCVCDRREVCTIYCRQKKGGVVKMLYWWHLCSVPGSCWQHEYVPFLHLFDCTVGRDLHSHALYFISSLFTLMPLLWRVLWREKTNSWVCDLGKQSVPCSECREDTCTQVRWRVEPGQSTAPLRGGGFGAWRSCRKLGVSLMCANQ